MQMHRTHPRRHLIGAITSALLVLVCCSGESTAPAEQVPEITQFSVVGPKTTAPVGETLQLAIDIVPRSASMSATWTSGDAALATVSGGGLVTGVAPGIVTITATSTVDPTTSGSLEITVVGCPAPRMVTSSPTGSTTWQDWIANPACG